MQKKKVFEKSANIGEDPIPVYLELNKNTAVGLFSKYVSLITNSALPFGINVTPVPTDSVKQVARKEGDTVRTNDGKLHATVAGSELPYPSSEIPPDHENGEIEEEERLVLGSGTVASSLVNGRSRGVDGDGGVDDGDDQNSGFSRTESELFLPVTAVPEKDIDVDPQLFESPGMNKRKLIRPRTSLRGNVADCPCTPYGTNVPDLDIGISLSEGFDKLGFLNTGLSKGLESD